MAASSFGTSSPPVFDGQNYQLWAIKMKTYLRDFDLWEVVETGNGPPPLRANPTMTQLKHYAEESAKKYKSLSIIHAAVTETIFTRIMACDTGKEAWDRLKEEFQGSEKTKQMQVLNLRREYELLKMKESEPVKEYANRLMKIVNQIRPNAMYAISMLSRFMQAPSECHFRAAKRVLRYLKGTEDYGILYRRNCEVKLKGFTNSDWAGSIDDMKSTSGSCFTLGSGMVPGEGNLERRILEVNRKRIKVAKLGSKTSFLPLKFVEVMLLPFTKSDCQHCEVELFQNYQRRLRIVVDSENEVYLMVHSRHLRDVVVLVIRGFAQRFMLERLEVSKSVY
ncbi:hypothetical protein GH714_017216 [Hevea brasiliensis]|uniref:AIR9 PH-like domain-containing protein n=1 Tax=Hevea brasiliensis TaxID=3981 RepID=A0A6A6MCZ3_HEVBR|nr:hypothetical protein GH714_017216 [Hevea brasiliensis]